MQYLDPLQTKSRRHIAFGLIRIFGGHTSHVPSPDRMAEHVCMLGSHLCKLAVVDFVMVSLTRGVAIVFDLKREYRLSCRSGHLSA